MKTYTTSAQKTTKLPIEDILQTLENDLKKNENLKFEQTKNANILKAKMKDDSVLVIAGFTKENGSSLAMIDHENVPADIKRTTLQKKWKARLDKLFP